MKQSIKLIIMSKLLYADIDYFKLPTKILDDIADKFKQLHQKQIDSHVSVLLTKEQLNRYMLKYNYNFDKHTIKHLQIFFFNCKNNKQEIIGDRIINFSSLMIQLNKITNDLRISGLTSKDGDIIVINYNNQQLQNNFFKIKNKLQHQLIHVFKKISNFQSMYKNNTQIDYLLSESQFPNMITDCCNYYMNHKSQFKYDLQLISKIYNYDYNVVKGILSHLHKENNQQLLFMALYKKHNKQNYNKIINKIIKHVYTK